MAHRQSIRFISVLFSSLYLQHANAQEKKPGDYLSIEPYGTYRNYAMEAEYKALPNYGAGIKLGRTIKRVHLELGFEYITKNYSQQLDPLNALGVHGGQTSSNYYLDYYNIPVLIHVGLLPEVGGKQQLYVSTGFLLINARNFRVTDHYADGYSSSQKLGFTPKIGGSIHAGLRYDHQLHKSLSLFVEASADYKFKKESLDSSPSSGSSINGNHADVNLPNDRLSLVGNIGIAFNLIKHPLDK